MGIKRYTVGKNLKSLWGFTESLAKKAGNFIVENDFTGLAEKWLDKVTDIADHISGSYAQSRNDNASDGDGFNASDSLGITPDAYPYDEPFLNALHFKRKSPFTGFHLGRQPSAIGLCSNSKELYEASYNKKHNQYFSIERGDPCTFGSANEMFIRSEPRFFLKEKSAPLWLNSIEREFGAAQGSYSKGNYPFGSGKDSHTFITSHDLWQ